MNRNSRRQDKYACNKLLKKIVEGRAAILIMSSVTLFALFGVRILELNYMYFRMISEYGLQTKMQMCISTPCW